MTLEEYYNQYKKTKCVVLFTESKYNSSEYEEISKSFEEYKRAYNYIYVKLNKTQRMELKDDFLDSLHINKGYQVQSKYKRLFEGMISYVESYELHFKDDKELLNQYYNCIKHKDYFKKLLDVNDEGYQYRKLIKHWVKQRENSLLKNTCLLSDEDEWVKLSRSFMSSLMERIIFTLRDVIEHKEQFNDLHDSSLRIRLSSKLRMLRQYPSAIRNKYEQDKMYAFQMKGYFLNLFELMYDFLELRFSVDIKKTPYFDIIHKVYDDIDNSIDDEKIRIEIDSKNNKTLNKKRINTVLETKPKQYLKDLFEDVNDYDTVISQLIEKKIIRKHDDETFKWNGISENVSSLSELRLLCSLVIVLSDRGYLISNLKNNNVALILSNTFPGSPVQEKNYGNVKRALASFNERSKEADYYNSFFFISKK